MSKGHILRAVRKESVNRMKRVWLLSVMGLSTLGLMGLTTTVFAHVVVTPAQSKAGAFEEYSMRVPCEKSDPTTKIVLSVPTGVQFDSYEASPGWTVSKGKAGGKEIVTWKATGTGIKPGQFEQFSFLAVNPKTPTELDWNAYQYYQDGTIVEWTGQKASNTPHSITDVISADAATVAQSSTAGAATLSSTSEWSLGWTTADTYVLTVAILSILLSGFALVMTLIGGNRKS